MGAHEASHAQYRERHHEGFVGGGSHLLFRHLLGDLSLDDNDLAVDSRGQESDGSVSLIALHIFAYHMLRSPIRRFELL